MSGAGVGYVAAFGGGLVSFASPCVLPLVPAYLSIVSLTATALGQALVARQALITRISGLVVLAFALFIVGSLVLKSPLLYQERRFRPRLSRYGPFAAPIAGMAFGFGWTPCIGPVLGSVLAIAATQARTVQGAMLLAAYSLGLGVPFLATGLAFGRMAGAFRWVKRHYVAITIASACALGFLGVLLTLNRLTLVTSQLQDIMRHLGLGRLVFLG